MIDPIVAWDKISTFETADKIREYFEEEKITGLRGDNRTCALARWLMITTGETVSVGSKIRIGFVDSNDFDSPHYEFDHTEATLDFIGNFDDGFYPELCRR